MVPLSANLSRIKLYNLYKLQNIPCANSNIGGSNMSRNKVETGEVEFRGNTYIWYTMGMETEVRDANYYQYDTGHPVRFSIPKGKFNGKDIQNMVSAWLDAYEQGKRKGSIDKGYKILQAIGLDIDKLEIDY